MFPIFFSADPALHTGELRVPGLVVSLFLSRAIRQQTPQLVGLMPTAGVLVCFSQ